MSNDMLDLRDLGKELNDLLELQRECLEPGGESFSEDNLNRLEALLTLAADLQCPADELEHYDEPCLITDSYFEEYARELADDCMSKEDRQRMEKWPFDCIDWKEAADELKMDYTSVSFDGQDWWIRSV